MCGPRAVGPVGREGGGGASAAAARSRVCRTGLHVDAHTRTRTQPRGAAHAEGGGGTTPHPAPPPRGAALEIVAAARVAPVDTGDGLWCCATLNPDAPTVNLVRASMTAAEPMWCVWTALGGGQSVCTASAADATRVFLLTLRHLKDRQVTLWDRHCAVLYRGAPVAEVVPYPSPGREWHARALGASPWAAGAPPLVAPRGPVRAGGAASSGTGRGP